MSEAPDLSRRYGPVGESGAWRQVSEAYYWDRLNEAEEIVRRLGAGAQGIGGQWMRLIEAEAITRKSSSVSRINDWLELELIEEECPPLGELGAEIEASCLGVARRFGWTPGPLVRVMVMAQHADTPWTPGRHGFCVDKHPFEKVCIPYASLRSSEELDNVIRHEFAHVMTLNWAQGGCPLWLDEAIAMISAEGPASGAKNRFRRGDWEWLEPHPLSAAFGLDRTDSHGQALVWQAYQQSAVIGQWMLNQAGPEGVGKVLEALGTGGFWPRLVRRALGQEEEDHALRQVFGLDSGGIFDTVLESLHERPAGP